MHIGKFSDAVAEHLNIPKFRADEIVATTFDMLLLLLTSGEYLTIPLKGKFVLKIKKSRTYEYEGRIIVTQEKKSIAFVPTTAYRKKLYPVSEQT